MEISVEKQGLGRVRAGRVRILKIAERRSPIVLTFYYYFRWRKKASGTIETRERQNILEFVAWKTEGSQEWRIPEERKGALPLASEFEASYSSLTIQCASYWNKALVQSLGVSAAILWASEA